MRPILHPNKPRPNTPSPNTLSPAGPASIPILSAAADAVAAGTAQSPPPPTLFHDLAVLLLQAGRFDESLRRVEQGIALTPRIFDLANLHGVVLKNLGRFDEALAVLDAAETLAPASLSPAINRGNIHLTRRNAPAAIREFQRAVTSQPANAEWHRLLGTALRLAGQSEPALAAFATARRLQPEDPRAWIDSVALLDDLAHTTEAAALLDQALAGAPDSRPLSEAKLTLLRRSGRAADALAFAQTLLPRFPGGAWVPLQLARCVIHSDRPAANAYLREAIRLEPANPTALTELADSLDRTRGPREAANIEEAYAIARRRLALGGTLLPHARSITSILNRACDFDAAASVGTFAALTRHWAETGLISALHHQMPQIRTDADRRLLLEAHRIWGRTVDAQAARAPIPRPPLHTPAIRTACAKIRLGLMSSDLRNHPVGYFTLPFIETYDRTRFEVFCYSYNSGPADPVQNRIATLSDRFRLAPALSDRDAACLIAADRLDMLIELGGTTYMNKLNVMAYKPAPIQASWLGYPHSAGPATIDYLVVDPHNRPTDDSLLIEQPLVLARSWIVLGTLGFDHRLPIHPATPEHRAGHLTFGTMNNPYKFTRRVIETWAKIVRAVDQSRYRFVRPEASGAAFQANLRAIFADHGVSPERVEFTAIRGTHMPHYNDIDIALDAVPQTGGTTTCEALWMGVPTISLVGPAFYERLSNSILINAGLPDLCTPTLDAYIQTALTLAANPARRAELRHTLRTTIRSTALGRPDLFTADFQDAVRTAVG